MAKSIQIDERRLSAEEFNIVRRASTDVFFFATLVCIIHPIRGKVKFDLFPFQKSVLWNFLNNRFNIVLKFRQAGITELIALYCLWLALFHPHKNIIIISIKDSVAKKVLRRIKFMYMNLPEFLQLPIINGRTGEYGTAQEIIFANGSTITSLPTTEQAGRSEAASLVVIDEAAVVRWADQLWASMWPVLSTGGSAIINSTAFGVGNWFHRTWVGALNKTNPFVPLRLRWQMHPERYRFPGDMEWYNEQAAALGPRRTAQEIDGDFLSSGNSVFDPVDIRAIEEDLLELEYEQVLMNKDLYIYQKPNRLEKYAIGADISTGRSRDFTSFSIISSSGQEVVAYKGKIPPTKAADLMMKFGKKYNMAVLAPETNDIGLAVTERIQNQGYPNLYYSKTVLKKKGHKREERALVPGWLTTTKNRPLIIDELEEDIRVRNLKVISPFFVNEAYTFIYDESNRPVAMGKEKRASTTDTVNLGDDGYTDDAIFATGISNRVRKEKITRKPIMAR